MTNNQTTNLKGTDMNHHAYNRRRSIARLQNELKSSAMYLGQAEELATALRANHDANPENVYIREAYERALRLVAELEATCLDQNRQLASF